MPIDRALGQPIRSLLKPGAALLPFALIGLFTARYFPREYYDIVWIPSSLVAAACFILFTPYLMAAAVCFYAISQLPFPKGLAVELWFRHALLLLAAAGCLWRTWRLWPAGLLKQKPAPAGATPAPWWGYLVGGVAVLVLFGVMAYFFHFQE